MTPLYTLLAPAAFAVAIPARLQAEPPLSVLFPPQGGETVIGETFQVVITAAGPFSRAVLERVEELQPAGAGPVLADQQGAFCLWLIPSGIAWAHPHGFCRSRGRSDLPPLDQTEPPGTYWVRTPRALGGAAHPRHRSRRHRTTPATTEPGAAAPERGPGTAHDAGGAMTNTRLARSAHLSARL